jgi:Zn-dependent M28 family amino/carboxypeptidase
MIFAIYLMNIYSHIFDGQLAFNDVKYQVDLGPRTMGSAAHGQASNWIVSKLQNLNWQVETQETVIYGQAVKNIIAKRGKGTPWIILASHYDSRSFADQDPNPEYQKLPVMGANDGASSVAILLEIARDLPVILNEQIWLVFLDDEDNGTSSGSGWANGSQYFVSKLIGTPDSVVVLDMVGDKDLNIYMERNSNPELNAEIWDVAKGLGYSQFIPKYKYDLIDDHIPFIEAGITAVDVIDFDYPYWHTTNDTLDKVSAESLKIVGETILKWLEQYQK